MRIYRTNKKQGFFQRLSLTNQLIFLNVILYFVSFVLITSYGEEFFLNNLALTPSLILAGKSLWTFLTSMFMHGSFFHIFANMFSLFFIGNFLEKIVGRKRFFWAYFVSGIVGGIFYVGASMIFGTLSVPAVGASGALFGLVGMLAVLVPYSKIYLIVGPLVVIVAQVLLVAVLPSSAVAAVNLIANILILVMIFSLFSFNSPLRKLAMPLQLPMWLLPIIAIVPLTIISLFVNLPIGNSAHIGGLVVGLLYAFSLKKKFPNKLNRIRGFFR